MPPKPVSIEAAKTHREAMKVRRIQEAAAEEKGLPNGWEGVEADTSFDYDQWVVDNAEPFKFSCSPLELSELGPGVVLYFDLVKYLGVLTFCFAALHCPSNFVQCHKLAHLGHKLKIMLINIIVEPISKQIIYINTESR